MSQGRRRLAAIMFTDIVGYTALGQRNEPLSLELVGEQRRKIRPLLKDHNGREVKTMGDALLIEFPSALDAVRCAFDIQKVIRESNSSKPEDRRVHLRIGVHLGDVVESKRDISGDAVNVASRIEPLAEDGGVCLSRQVYDHVQNKFELPLESLGVRMLKNVKTPMEVYKIVLPWAQEKTVPATRHDKKRIAILPFANISENPADEYFADGMTEELIATMSRIGGLKVIARTSVMGYKGGQKKISDVAKELEVGTVLEGSVRKAGERLRITVQLIDSQTSDHMWAESYDRELRDVFAVQSDIATTVAEALKVQLLSSERAIIEKKQTVDPEAYALYLKGRYLWNERSREGVNKAIKYFEQVVKIDPRFAPAYSGLADCYNILLDYSWMDPALAGDLARDFSEKAIAMDDNLAEAHASLALTLTNRFWDFTRAATEMKRAIELRPNYAPAYHWYGIQLFQLGRPIAEAYSMVKRGLDLDPYSRVLNMVAANSLAMLGENQAAMVRYKELVDLYPDFAALRFWISQVHAWASEYEAAIDEARRAVEIDKTSLFSRLNLAWVSAVAGKREEARKTLDDVLSHRGTEYMSPVLVGEVELAMGSNDEGYRWLEKGLEQRDPNLLYFRVIPWFKKYQSDPRWNQIDEKIRRILSPRQ
ncbi:MAG TPA: adenylate/guanylate cyclase domain-containing protein, partial [Candidatus Angelobacter sp.]|nr:adenylate/guanylate cyclase domain-containing protein [Candidatus Angelobacter sp.]